LIGDRTFSERQFGMIAIRIDWSEGDSEEDVEGDSGDVESLSGGE
jgi:hypothetical protein